jgi:hypothetical protein
VLALVRGARGDETHRRSVEPPNTPRNPDTTARPGVLARVRRCGGPAIAPTGQTR